MCMELKNKFSKVTKYIIKYFQIDYVSIQQKQSTGEGSGIK